MCLARDGRQRKMAVLHTTTQPSSLCCCPSRERWPLAPLTAPSVRPSMRAVTRNARRGTRTPQAPPPSSSSCCIPGETADLDLVFGGGTGGSDGRSGSVAVGDHHGDFFSSSNDEGDGVRGSGADLGPYSPPRSRAYAAAGWEGLGGLWGVDALAMRCGGRMSENEAERFLCPPPWLCLCTEVPLR
jgi:hypothetical protein